MTGLEFEYSICVSSRFVDNALEIGGDLYGSDGKQSGRGMKSIQPLGLIARPRDPDVDSNANPTKGAGLLYSFHGGEAFAMPTTDPRSLVKVPPVKKGGTAIYSAPGGCLTFDGDNGSLSVLVPNSDGSKNHLLSIDSKNNSIQLITAGGLRLHMTDGGVNSLVLQNKSGSAYIELNDNGIVLNGSVTFNGGMAMGNVASAQPVPVAPPLQAWETTIAKIVGKVGAAVNVLAPGTVDPSDLVLLVTQTTTAAGPSGLSSKLSASP